MKPFENPVHKVIDLQAIWKRLEMRKGTPTHGAYQRSDVFQAVLDQRQRPVSDHVFEVLVKSVRACCRVWRRGRE